MKRVGVYSEYAREILGQLATVAPDGKRVVGMLLEKFGIPKSSGWDIIHSLIKDGFVICKPTFKNNSYIEITDKGRLEYDRLVDIEHGTYELPFAVKSYLRKKKPPIRKLFPIQKNFVSRGLLYKKENVCVFGYPGSGKTLIAELCIARSVSEGQSALYCTPYKALDWQKYQDFKVWFGTLNALVVVTDGDNPVSRKALTDADVVIATYERVIEAFRRSEEWLQKLSFVCVDEISLLADETRGPTLDTLLALLRSAERAPRIATLSSLVGNAWEISDWLGAVPLMENRPPPGITLNEYVVEASKGRIEFLRSDGVSRVTESSKDATLYVVEECNKRKETTLVFVGSRGKAESTARRLKRTGELNRELEVQCREFIKTKVWEITAQVRELTELIPYGIAFHHAGLQSKIRRFIETLLDQGKLRTVVATTTLSHGIDYSIDNVIIDIPSMDQVHELQGYEYINLKGRTGRPGKSKSASIYVLCGAGKARKTFERLLLGSPESLQLKLTGYEEQIANLALSTLENHEIQMNKLQRIVSQTLAARNSAEPVWLMQGVARKLMKSGFINKSNGRYLLTKLGEEVNRIGLSPEDAKIVLALRQNPSLDAILDAASNIDLAKSVRRDRAGLGPDPTVDLLKRWIEGVSLSQMSGLRLLGSRYGDQDILNLASYTAKSLGKIRELVHEAQLKDRLQLLEIRVKFGIREDWAKSQVFPNVTDACHGDTLLVRRFMKIGYLSPEQLVASRLQGLCQRAGLNKEETDRIGQLFIRARAENTRIIGPMHSA